jgi:hypothetical protein
MTPEQFIWWLEGFLDGGADINMDVREQLRDKLSQVGAAPAQKQPAADRPKTVQDSLMVSPDGYLRGVGIGLTPGGFTGVIGGPTCINTTTLASTAASSVSMAELSAAARACE